MKVICNYCGGLTDETEAIKMSYADYMSWKSVEDDIPMISIFPTDYDRHTQICQPCYFGNNKDSDPKPVGPSNHIVKEDVLFKKTTCQH